VTASITRPWVGLFDSFAERPFGGNVAGVVLSAEALPEQAMALVARELAAPTTGFVAVDAAARQGSATVRFFTPKQEIEACGHVTVAIAQALLLRQVWSATDRGHRVTAKGGSYPIGVETVGDASEIEMIQRLSFIQDAPVRAGQVSDLLGGLRMREDLPLRVASTGLRHLMVPAASLADMSDLALDAAAVGELAELAGVDTIAIFVIERTRPGLIHVRMRDLCASIGDLEEPASGTTSGALTAYLHQLIEDLSQGPGQAVVRSGVEMGRPSRIVVGVTEGEGGIQLSVRGTAQLMLEGTLVVDPLDATRCLPGDQPTTRADGAMG
jgi:PhzF family phenazine biosynthesis protein